MFPKPKPARIPTLRRRGAKVATITKWLKNKSIRSLARLVVALVRFAKAPARRAKQAVAFREGGRATRPYRTYVRAGVITRKLRSFERRSKFYTMTTETLIKKLNKEVEVLRHDMRRVEKVLFAATQDPEGEYRPSFVKKILERSNKQEPAYRFTDKDGFLKHVRSSK